MIAQARLGPGRIHHCMRLIGMAERAFDLMVQRAKVAHCFGGPVSDQGVVRDWIAEARYRIEQARLLVLKTAWLIDTVGNRAARTEISAIKVVVPNMALWVLDKAIQVHGGMGVSDDTPLRPHVGRRPHPPHRRRPRRSAQHGLGAPRDW